MSPRSKYPLRVRQAGTDPVHAAKEHGVKGHDTPCLLWLDPAVPHIWCEDDAEITCAKCIERLGPPPLGWASTRIPKTGTLQERLTEEVRGHLPLAEANLTARSIAEVIETWRRDAEERVRLAVDAALVDLVPDAARPDAARDLTESVLRSLGVGGNAVSEEPEE